MKCTCTGLTSINLECHSQKMNQDFIIKDLKEKIKNYKRMFN
jgi:hypothetical protein